MVHFKKNFSSFLILLSTVVLALLQQQQQQFGGSILVTAFITSSQHRYNDVSRYHQRQQQQQQRGHPHSSRQLQLDATMYPWEGPLRNGKMKQMGQEETLLQIHCRYNPQDNDDADVMTQIQQYVQSFPFAAVLPVQPLKYLPTEDGGVEVTFLRKKTKEKGSVDGGMRFFILPHKPPSSSDEEDDDEDDAGGDASMKDLEIIVKRNSEGQTVTKMFSEKLVVQAFVQSFLGKDPEDGKEPVTNKEPPTKQLIQVESVFHKWMT